MGIARSTEFKSKAAAILVWIFRAVLGLLFISVALAKLTGGAQTVQLFAAIGWVQWFRFATGVLDLIGAILILIPRWTFYGAFLISCTIGLATVLYIVLLHNNPVVPLVLTSLAITLASVTRPRRAKRNGSNSITM
jgi:putative oxidoreductase